MTDLKRLGQRGSYRLGRLKVQGTAPPGPPPPLRPRFRRRRRGPAALWLLAAAAGAAVIAGGAAAGLWFAPFAVGLAAGLANRIGGWQTRALVPAVAAAAVAGWGIALWWPALHGGPVGGHAPAIAALVAWPGSAAAGVLFALLVAVLQVLAGLWLGCTLAPYPDPPVPAAEAGEASAAGAVEAGAVGAGPGDDRGSGRQPGPAARP